MVLTHERAYTLTKVMNADKERAKAFLNLNAEDATVQINSLGYDFKIEEIREYGNAISCYMGGHIRDDILSDISGGMIIDILTIILSIDKIRW